MGGGIAKGGEKKRGKPMRVLRFVYYLGETRTNKKGKALPAL